MAGRYDKLWKGMLEVVCEDLLRFVFPDAEKVLDLDRGFEFLDKELGELYPDLETAANTRIVDKLVKVGLNGGGEAWMLFHVEVQGGHDPDFARRMFTYYYRILDRYNRPVTAVAIFTGRHGKNMPDRYESHFMGTHEVYRYNTLCLSDYTDADLRARDNPFAVVMLVAKQRLHLLQKARTIGEWDRELLEQKLLIVKLLREKRIFGDRKIKAIVAFLKNYVVFKKPETNRKFDVEIDQLITKTESMDIFEQLIEIKAEEAREEEQAKFVRYLLRDTEFSPDKIASLVGVSIDFVEQIKNDQN